MKIRTDFVTNSSSSSFVLAQKNGLSEAQKNAILSYVEDQMLGKPLLTPDSTEDEIQRAFEENYIEEEYRDDIRQALAAGKTIRYGSVDFECCEYSYGALFTRLWEVMEEADPDIFSSVKDNLDY